jgi:hypothetical protein
MSVVSTWTIVLGLAGAAVAQPGPGPSATTGETSPPPTEPAVSPPSATPVDPPELRAAYDAAFAELLVGNWPIAAAAFADIANRSVEDERRGAASELARFAREMDDRGESGPQRQSGRADFVVTTTLASFYSSFVLVDLFGVSDEKNATLLVTGTTLGGFGASLFLTNGRKITDSMAAGYGAGLAIGLGNGLLLSAPLGIDPDADCSSDPLIGCDDGEVNQNFLLFGLGSMAAGGAAGMYLAYRYDPTAPQARFTALMGVNGLITMGLGMIIADPDDPSDKTVLGLLAAGLDIGVVAGGYFARKLDWSSSRLTYVTLSEFLGGLTAGAIAVVSFDDEEGGGADGQVAAAIVLGGVWGGFALSTYLTRDMKPHARYRTAKAAKPPVAITPFVTEHGGRGISLAGSF